MPVSKKFKAAKRLVQDSVAEFQRAHEEGLKSRKKANVAEKTRGITEAIGRERAAIKKLRKGIKLQREAIEELPSRKR